MSEDTKLVSTRASEMLKPKLGMGISGARRAAQARLAETKPEDCPHRLGLIFDDSGSMGGDPIKDAISAVASFLSSCSPLETSVTIYPMNKDSKPLTNDYPLINMFVTSLNHNLGGTPLYSTLIRMLNETSITRGIVFSDGAPNSNEMYAGSRFYGDENEDEEDFTNKQSNSPKMQAIALAKEKKTPIDTIYIGEDYESGFKEMEWIAAQTGGIFVHFKDSASLNRSLKYLSPGLRGLLTNPDVKARIERGETI